MKTQKLVILITLLVNIVEDRSKRASVKRENSMWKSILSVKVFNSCRVFYLNDQHQRVGVLSTPCPSFDLENQTALSQCVNTSVTRKNFRIIRNSQATRRCVPEKFIKLVEVTSCRRARPGTPSISDRFPRKITDEPWESWE